MRPRIVRGAPAAPALPAPPRRRSLRDGLALAAVVLGAAVAADGAATILWQEPLTALYAMHEQSALAAELTTATRSAVQRTPAPAVTASAPTVTRPALPDLAGPARRLGHSTASGHALGRISIPAIGAQFVFVQGVDAGALRRGPGHYAGTALPGQRGTVGIAGHRTTYLAPFHDLDALRPGDRVILRMPYGEFTYRVTRTRIVSPDRAEVLRAVGGRPQLVLTACHPLDSASHRIAVFARLTRTRRF